MVKKTNQRRDKTTLYQDSNNNGVGEEQLLMEK